MAVFTDNQAAILRISLGDPLRESSMSELGALLGKAPGVFQRGLNALERDGFVVSRRQGNLRLLKINTPLVIWENGKVVEKWIR